jgi:myo-inositol-1(or 4)-monophosphatase
MDIEPIQRAGIKAAYRSGRVLNHHFGQLTHVDKKGAIDLVTAADLESEEIIIDTIHEKFPDHTIIAEESGIAQRDKHACWIIDPLDGTTNYVHGLGIFAVSIAFTIDGRIVMGIVYNPLSGELFTAIEGQGANLSGQPIQATSTTQVSESLLVTGFPYVLGNDKRALIQRFSNCLAAARGIRRLGSAALDLCYVACGRFDGFWEENLKPWDTAAGLLIAREAGGVVTDFNAQPFQIEHKQILATNGKIHQEMLDLLNLKDTQ